MTKLTRVSPEATEVAKKTKTVAATRDVDAIAVKVGEDAEGGAPASKTAAKKTAAKKTAAKKTAAKKTAAKKTTAKKAAAKQAGAAAPAPRASKSAAARAVPPRMPMPTTMISSMTTAMKAK